MAIFRLSLVTKYHPTLWRRFS